MNESKITVVEKSLKEEVRMLLEIEARMKLDAQSKANLQENIVEGKKLLTRLQEEDKKSKESNHEERAETTDQHIPEK